MTDPTDKTLPIDPGAVPVAPGLEDVMQRTSAPSSPFRAPPEYTAVDRRTIGICAGAVVVAIGAGLAAQLLIRLIGFVTNATFYGRLSTAFVAPRFGTHNPLLIIAIPIGGALVVGLMARYGSAAIRGHGIPEVMERVLFGESRIPLRVLFLCTHNSARSQLAEGILRKMGGEQVEAFSAGSEPTEVAPDTINALRDLGIDPTPFYAKALATFTGQRFDYIITVCDRVRDMCPVFPGDPVQIHWSFADPSLITDPEQRYRAFREVAVELRTRIRYLLLLPHPATGQRLRPRE